MFDRKGVFMFPEEGFDEDTLMMQLLEYGLEDIQREEGSFILTCAFEDYGLLNTRLESLNIEAESSLQRIPANQVALDLERARPVLKLLEILEEDDDIQNIFHNLEITEEIAAAMSGN
ncbi:MAG: YebC/PmpR family DNA-binding transcriptional regulator, partial [Bacteroidetes bacterium]